MTIPTVATWDLTSGDGGPTRPSVDQMGEAALENDARNPPIAPKMPTAPMLNQWQMQIAALGKVCPALVISVRFSAGTPSVYKFTAPTGNLVTDDFTVTDNGTGDTTIAWPANTLPASVAEPMVSINGGTAGEATVDLASATSVRVKTKASSSAADLAFTVTVF